MPSRPPKFRAVAIDLDGTIYNGNSIIPGAAETVAELRAMGLEVLFCTNNSTKTGKQISGKLCSMDIPCAEEMVYTSGDAAANCIRGMGASKTYVLGSSVLKQSISAVTEITDIPEDALALAVGFDPTVDYEMITYGVRAALAAEKIVFCNEDLVFRKEDGKIYPGPGAVTAAIRACSKREPDAIAGKPSPYMMDAIENRTGLEADEVLVVGDSFDTDIMFAKNCGTAGILIGENVPGIVTVNRISEIPQLVLKAETSNCLRVRNSARVSNSFFRFRQTHQIAYFHLREGFLGPEILAFCRYARSPDVGGNLHSVFVLDLPEHLRSFLDTGATIRVDGCSVSFVERCFEVVIYV